MYPGEVQIYADWFWLNWETSISRYWLASWYMLLTLWSVQCIRSAHSRRQTFSDWKHCPLLCSSDPDHIGHMLILIILMLILPMLISVSAALVSGSSSSSCSSSSSSSSSSCTVQTPPSSSGGSRECTHAVFLLRAPEAAARVRTVKCAQKMLSYAFTKIAQDGEVRCVLIRFYKFDWATWQDACTVQLCNRFNSAVTSMEQTTMSEIHKVHKQQMFI